MPAGDSLDSCRVRAPEGNETVLYSFTRGADGGDPVGGPLLLDSRGHLYGAAGIGGTNGKLCRGGEGCGTIFDLDPTGTLTVLHAFNGKSEGWGPEGLVRGSDGNFYGVTTEGGIYRNGTVFRLTAHGKETLLHSFAGGTDGAFPQVLLIDKQNNLYGTTYYGGPSNSGTVFKLTP